MRFTRILQFLIFTAISLLFSYCQTPKKLPPTEIIAWIDQEPLPLEEFRSFYETDPNFGLDSTGFSALQDELDKFIDYHLAYNLAKKEGLIRTPEFIRLKKWEEKQAILRALYREKIESHLNVNNEELYRMYQKINTEIHVRHLFTPDSNQAWQWYRDLLNGASFKALAKRAFQDSALANNGGDLGWCKVSRLDEKFAQAALQLAPGAISTPVKTRWGYHIIQLLNIREQKNLGEGDFLAQRKKLEKMVKQKKSRLLTRRFIANYIGKINPQPVESTFWALWRSCLPGTATESKRLSQPRILDDLLIDRIFQTIPAKLDSPLIHYRGGEVTLKEYLNALKEVPISSRPRFQTPKQLSYAIGKWIRDELLLQEALREKLNKKREVVEEVQEILREQSYLYYLSKEFEQITVPTRVSQYFTTPPQQRLKISSSDLKHFKTIQDWKWHQAQFRLHQKLRQFFPGEIRINQEMLKKENRFVDWNSRIPLFIIRTPS